MSFTNRTVIEPSRFPNTISFALFIVDVYDYEGE
jgi:hypothetical protein